MMAEYPYTEVTVRVDPSEGRDRTGIVVVGPAIGGPEDVEMLYESFKQSVRDAINWPTISPSPESDAFGYSPRMYADESLYALKEAAAYIGKAQAGMARINDPSTRAAIERALAATQAAADALGARLEVQR